MAVDENAVDPVGTAAHARRSLRPDGTWLPVDLGAQAGEGRLREVADAAGFSSFRRATQTPFNLILKGRP